MKTKAISVVMIVIGAVAIMGILAGAVTKLAFREINEEKQYSLEAIDEIKVTMTSTQVQVIRTEKEERVRFHYYGKSLQELTLVSEISNKTLSVSARRKYVFLGTCEETRLDIYVPGQYQRNLAIQTSSGTVRMDSLELADFTFRTSSGGLDAEGITAGRAALSTTSGKLNVKTLHVRELEIKGSSSPVNIGECTVKEAGIKTTSGKIRLENSQGNLTIQGTSGSVWITCREFDGRKIDIETTSGAVTLNLPAAAGFSIEAKMTSGKFQSDFALDTAGNSDTRNISGKTGTANNQVSLQTKSGQIKILKMDR